MLSLVQVIVIGSYKMVEDDVEIRFLWTPIGWKPDSIIDHREGTVSPPPSCFKPTQQVIDDLNTILEEGNLNLDPVGVYEPEMN